MGKVMGLLLFIYLISSISHAQDFKDCTALQEKCFSIENSPQKSFYLRGPKNSKVAVLVHGLSDSPYYTKDLALLLNSQKYTVYSVLLSGHGTDPNKLFQTGMKDWIEDIDNTIHLAMKETGATRVLLGGFSMGGALVTYFAENPNWSDKISKLILMAPAFQIKKDLGRAICATGAYHLKTWAWNNPGTSPVHYNKMTFKAVCELTDLGSIVRTTAHLVSVPTFMAVSDSDQTINSDAAIDTFKNMSSKKKEVFYIRGQHIQHTEINFRFDPIENKKNPLFNSMSQRIIQFLK